MTTASAIKTTPRAARYQPDTSAGLLALYRKDELLQDAPLWLKELRNGAMTALSEHGIPGPKLERWKYTNIQQWLRNFDPELRMPEIAANDGDKLADKLWDHLTDPANWLKDLMKTRDETFFRYGDMMLWDLNTLFAQGGIVVDVPAGRIVDKPLNLAVTGSGGGLYNPRIIIRLGEGSRLTLIETRTGQGRYWQNGVTQVVIGQGARLTHVRLQDNSPDSLDTLTAHAQIARDGQYDLFNATGGAGTSRVQVHARIDGPGASCNLYGVNILSGSQHADITAEVEHAAPHCTSNQFVRSVLNGQAHCVFQGKVHVHQAAQKTDAYQLSNALILSEGAEMDTRPELEIYADDVKCSHGATTGRLEDEPLFYLRSRGIPEEEARALLISAFVDETVDKLEDEAVRGLVQTRIREWLNRA